MGSSATLLGLPVELIREICLAVLQESSRVRIHADVNSNLRGLARLSRACKTLHIIAAPLLAELKNKSHSQSPFELNFLRYIRNIMSDPSLAAREEFFTADYYDKIGPFQDGDAELLDTVARGLNVKRMPSRWLNRGLFDGSFEERCGCGNNSELEHDCRWTEKARKSELTNLILMSLPKLASLSLSNDLFPQLRRRCLLFLREANLSASVGDPEQDDCATWHTCDASEFANIFLAAPYLERLTIHNCTGCSQPLSLRWLRHIRLTSSCLSLNSVHNLFGSCGRLSSVEYESCGANVGEYLEELDPEAWPRDFINALLNSRESLRQLTVMTDEELRVNEDEIRLDGNGTEQSGLVSREDLQHFPALRKAYLEGLRYDATTVPRIETE
ncbi:hypothetical protein GGR57DRAFT_484639 [Xylariaceae sp. FL1272]|nr:hypothetical protein GGR57DRAFT_484639 [Xylariaceae sp. FL1272]